MAPGRTRIRAGAPADASAEFLPSLLQLCGGPSTRLTTVNSFGDNHQPLRPHVFNFEADHAGYTLGSLSTLLRPSSDLPPESRQQFIQPARGSIKEDKDQDQDTRVAPIFQTWRVDHDAEDDRNRLIQDALHAIDPVSIMKSSFLMSFNSFRATRRDMRCGPRQDLRLRIMTAFVALNTAGAHLYILGSSSYTGPFQGN